MRLVSTAIARERDREQEREGGEERRSERETNYGTFACVSYPLQSCARETEIESKRERGRRGDEERKGNKLRNREKDMRSGGTSALFWTFRFR